MPDFIEMPDSLLAKIERHHNLAIYEEKHGEEVWCYSWEKENGLWMPSLITIMKKDTWKTWDGSKWGKRYIIPRYAYGGIIYDNHLDAEIFGKDIETLQDEARWKRAKRESERREVIIKGITSRMKKIPAKIQKWMHRNLKHYIIFEAGSREGYCTDCAAHVHFEYDRPKNRKYIRCPNCGHIYEARTYKTVPKYTQRPFFWVQPCKGGYLLRCLIVERKNPWSIDSFPEETTEELLCGSVINGEEHWIEKRYFFNYYIKNDRDTWELNGCSGATKNYLSPFFFQHTQEARRKRDTRDYEFYCPITYGHTETWIKETGSKINYILPYLEEDISTWSGWKFIKRDGCFETYPQIEGLYKNGFEELAESLAHSAGCHNYKALTNRKASELHKFLKIKKETFRILQNDFDKGEVTWGDIRVIQALEKTDCRREDFKNIVGGRRYNTYNLMQVIDTAKELHVGFTKLHKYIKDQKKNVKYNQEQFYHDYIEMCKSCGVDLTDDFNLYPRNLKKSHDAVLKIKQECEQRQRLKAAEKRDESFRKAVGAKLEKRFTLENDDFIIRPALSASEIVFEGQQQHNCVGSAGYIEKMMKHECMILFLRMKDTPNTPYYTVETDMEGKVRQAYAAYNKHDDNYQTVIIPLLDLLRKKVQRGKKRAARG